MAYTEAQKKAMYETGLTNLTGTALSLKKFSEDEDLFVDGNPTSEQQQASQDYHALAVIIGRFAVETKANEPAK